MEENEKAICVADVRALLGEGPVWAAGEQALYWVDIKGNRIFRRDRTGRIEKWDTPFAVCSLAPRAAGSAPLPDAGQREITAQP